MTKVDMDALKRQAALAAVAQIEDGMVVGLGTGSTAAHAVEGLAHRIKNEGIKVIAVPTSTRTLAQAQSLGIPLATLDQQPVLDLAIDGADEIEISTLHLIKGAGGALLQEKLVEVCAKRLIIIADHSKKVPHLGTRFPVPVEVVRFGWTSTLKRLESLGCKPVRRMVSEGSDHPYVTDEGNFLIDCSFPTGIQDPENLAQSLKGVCGVVEHGLFIGMAQQAIIATPTGIETLNV